MKKYEIVKIEHNDYELIIFSGSFETPFSYLDNICEDLREFNICNRKVIFDMLLNMGNTSERFAEVIFNGNCFIDSTFEFVKIDKTNKLRKISADFFRDKSSLLENSILNTVQRRMINKGIAI